MMKKLRAFLDTKERPVLLYIAMAAAVGVFLLLFGNGMLFDFNGEEPSDGEQTSLSRIGAGVAAKPEAEPGEVISGEPFAKERALEERLESAFAVMEDVGKVKVLVSLSPESETVYAADVNATESVTKETDSQGGSRETSSRSRDEETIVFTDSTGTDRPLVLREIDQKIEGAVIIAEGGDNVFVKDALTKAACTILGVEANKVQVLKMKM